VRPRGYLEVRYLDAQPGADWITPVAVLTTLLGDRATTGEALDLALPTAGDWAEAFRYGLASPPLRRTATAVLDLAARRLDGVEPALRDRITETIDRRLAAAHGETR
jgi:glutamate--cysteine ligase